VLDCETVSFHYLVAPFLIEEEDCADKGRLTRFQVVLSFLATALLLDENFVEQFFKQMMRRLAVVKIKVIIDAMYAAYKKLEGDNFFEKVTMFAKRLNAKFFRPARLIQSAAPRKSFESNALLMEYASAGNTQGVMNAIAQGCRVNEVPNYTGDTPLTVAAKRGHTNVVRVLIDYGAELDHVAVRSGGSALEIAAAGGFAGIVSLLIQNNADVHISSATLEAARNGHTAVVSMLLDEGVDVNYKVKNKGCSALMMAASKGHIETMEFLLSKGADISAVSNDGYTPLMFAVRSGVKEAASFLIASGADVNQLTTHGTALQVAPRGAREMIKMLIHAGAVISKINSDYFFSSEIAPIIQSWFPARGSDIPPRFDVMMDAFLLKLDAYPLHLFNEWKDDESRVKRVLLIISMLVKLDCQETNFYLFTPFLAESDVSSLNKFGVVLKFLLTPLESDILQADRKVEIVSFNIKTLNEIMRNAANVRPTRIVDAMFVAYTEVNAEMAILKRAMRTIPDVHIGGVLRFANGPFGIYSKFVHSLLHIPME
jgi:ankyrin repeat protein